MIAGVGLTHESVHAGLALGESVGRELHLDGRGAQALVAGVECDGGKVTELRIPLELAAPGIDAGLDLGFGLAKDLPEAWALAGTGPVSLSESGPGLKRDSRLR